MIGIIGFGRFGALVTRCLSVDARVRVYSRSVPPAQIEAAGGVPASLERVCRQRVLILCVPISALARVLEDVRPHLGPATLVVDVCSVKEAPVEWMYAALPPGTAFLATHPMFGPDSAAHSLQGHKIVLCPERIASRPYGRIRSYLEARGLEVIETTPQEHDRQIAVSLALVHFIGRSLDECGAGELPIDTEGYKRLLHVRGVVSNDTWELFQDMHRYNRFAASSREAFLRTARTLDERLHGR